MYKSKQLTLIAISRCSISESIPKNLASSKTPNKTKQYLLITRTVKQDTILPLLAKQHTATPTADQKLC